MEDPVVASDGYSYEASFIKAWYNSGQHDSPLTRERISPDFIKNRALRDAIQEYKNKRIYEQRSFPQRSFVTPLRRRSFSEFT